MRLHKIRSPLTHASRLKSGNPPTTLAPLEKRGELEKIYQSPRHLLQVGKAAQRSGSPF
ncbi:hypothetical protein FDUTEX481_08365 [Tolypothrix sp. PCC 7601]|nr:hypothetical protein FDUTEX481_08365 [Tolypothrix sp. PCC 7601]